MESDAEQVALLDINANARVRTRQREVSHRAALVSRAGHSRRESDMDACRLIGRFAEIAAVFWPDRHARSYARTRSGKPSVRSISVRRHDGNIHTAC